MSGFGGTVVINSDGYLQIPLPIVSASPLSVHVDNYGVNYIPVKIVSPNTLSTSIDKVNISSIPVNTTNIVSTHIDGYSISPLPVIISSPRKLSMSLDSYNVGPFPVIISSPHKLSTSIDSYSISPLPVMISSPHTISMKLDGYSINPLPVIISSPHKLSTSIDGYSINPLPVHIKPQTDDNVSLIVGLSDSHYDSLSRVRVSENNVLFSSQLNYDLQPLRWDQAVAGGGSISHLINESSARLKVGTGATDSAIRQTKRYFQYLSGQSLQMVMSLRDAYGQTNVTKRIGYFDANNGIFLQTSGVNTSFVIRSSISGSPSDSNAVLQSNWNLDTFNGSGPSGINLNLTKSNILIIDLQWLGVGRVRVGFDIDGKVHYAHQFLNANNNPTVYMSRGSLPCRYEISNTSGTLTSGFLKQICVGIAREGGKEEEGIIACADSGFASITATTTARSALCVRLKTAYVRAFLKPILAIVSNAETASVRFQIILNPTLTGSLSWTSIDSATEQSISQLTYTAGSGQRLASGYVVSTTGNKETISIPLLSILGVSSNIVGTSDILAIILESSTGTQNCEAILQYFELY